VVEGFWIVQFEGLRGNGGGVALFIKGQVFGGDSGSTYIGSYQVDANTIKAHVKIHNYLPGVVSIIGVEGDYELEVAGTVDKNIIKASGSPVGLQAAGMALRLTKVGELPG